MSCQLCSRWNDEPQLRIAELRHTHVMLNRDQFFPGYVLLIAREHVTELFHLDPTTRGELMEEVNAVAAALYKVFAPDKINYELLGNMVPHMHWHIVPRFAGDPLWPRPIWSEAHDERHLSTEEQAARIEAIREALEKELKRS